MPLVKFEKKIEITSVTLTPQEYQAFEELTKFVGNVTRIVDEDGVEGYNFWRNARNVVEDVADQMEEE
jgi:hypothetical protein